MSKLDGWTDEEIGFLWNGDRFTTADISDIFGGTFNGSLTNNLLVENIRIDKLDMFLYIISIILPPSVCHVILTSYYSL